ncbi:glycosyltransferase family protein [Engelhardtia mirabilis]|uniref:Teichoic acid biosynthesis protein n=1 Tax=Engelhardtia mirabilis TaxID=2528011 RepID=A0A518BN44_9BACT|nr:hypothetical protein Pla133_34730 [Planctomycetes bacterium Pla133]QDV02702.1 hypothetical protein Pla86_34710 [Planctomycetes bacterium Pla86]
MATIFYSMAGEGRGHATRVRTVVEHLRERHRLILLAPGDAYDLLEPAYRGSDVEVVRIPCLRFVYDSRQRVSVGGSVVGALRYVGGLRRLVAELGARMRRERADLLLTDFDPGAPRAAEAVGVPYLALDHQSFMWASDLSFLPTGLRAQARLMVPGLRAMYRRQTHTISSSFFQPDPKPGLRDVTFVGTMLRDGLLEARPSLGEHLVAYCRRTMPTNVLEALRASPVEVRVYGLGERLSDGPLRFRPISEEGFIEDLATCRAVVASAGNQLLGEVLFLGKPVLALPEARQSEQLINCHFLERMGGGEWVAPQLLSGARLGVFLDRAPGLAGRIDRDFARGNERAVAAIEAQLEAVGAGV